MSPARSSFYVTTPIYYVNDIPHIGHAYTTVAADILARFGRMRGKQVFFLTGTDEHGQKVQKAAEARGLTPKEHADSMAPNFRDLWRELNISNDAFIRTTDEGHGKVVRHLLQRLWEKGLIEKRTYSGWYCTPDERFWTEKDLIGGKCPECGRDVERIEEQNYFFLMSRFGGRLARHVEENPDYILPETRRNEVLGFLRAQPLGDLCISRPKKRLSWGIPLPFDEEFVTYVWFDALVNYYSAPGYLAPSGQWWPADVHIIGKDILTTHAVYWSTMLMALGLPLPGTIFAHGWWMVDGKKMSKSVGNVVAPGLMAKKYGVDAFRYFLFREIPFGHDGDFSEAALINRINTELANDLGNLSTRTFTMIGKYFGGVVPEPAEEEAEMKSIAEGILPRMEESLRVLQFQKAIEEIWKLVSHANKYIESNAPWALAKSPETRGRLGTVLYSAAEALRFLALYLYPFMPAAMEALWREMNLEGKNLFSLDDLGEQARWGGLRPGTVLSEFKALFPRIEKEKAKKETPKVEEAKKPEA
ncbi:MAG: methionine--tRNA ligase, partial [Nitrospiraceae bacterium]|nr:methionine--tRNA ligase [Nitrospiraceae bacterium]